MPIRKQQFYEGAAIHMLMRHGQIENARYEDPFFVFNSNLFVYLKYSTHGRSPWSFTFMPEEQAVLHAQSARCRIVIGLICGDDGVAALDCKSYCRIASLRECAVHIACFRKFGEHYEVSGPAGVLKEKVAPSNWRRILDGDRK